MAFGSKAETLVHQVYKDQNFQAIGIDVWDGAPAGVESYKQTTKSTFPLCMIGSPVQIIYAIPRDYSIVIDQEGIIKYKGDGVQESLIQNTINDLLTTAVRTSPGNPSTFVLEQNFPNPFYSGAATVSGGNSATIISLELSGEQNVSLKIYDQTGRLIRTLFDNNLNRGKHEFSWDGRDVFGNRVSSGVYLSVLQGKNIRKTKKMMVFN